MNTMITLALSKGRIFDETLPLLKAAGIAVAEDPEKSRKLIIGTNRSDVRIVLVRATDVPTYVQYGAADMGIAGKDGAPGRDAFQLDDLELKLLDDGRTVEFSFGTGDARMVRTLKFDVVLDRGVYRPGMRAEKGDGVTFGGQYFIAQRDTEAKPGESPDWRLSVKRGRDGKDARELEEGSHG